MASWSQRHWSDSSDNAWTATNDVNQFRREFVITYSLSHAGIDIAEQECKPRSTPHNVFANRPANATGV
jgi:hypothetical protein